MEAARLVFLAAPVAGQTLIEHRENLLRAKRWMRWAIDHYPGHVIVANWITYCEVLDDANPAHRELGMAHSLCTLEICHELWLVGGRISSGMRKELIHALGLHLPVRDFTFLGLEPPAIAPPLVTVPYVTAGKD